MSVDLPLVCIIGAPRSGTTWLQAMIGVHPLVCTAQELRLFDLFTGPWEQSWQQLIDLQRTAGGGRRGLRIVWSDEDFHDVLTGLVKDVYARVLATQPGATVLLDKSPGYSRFVAHISRLAPRVRFIHVLRDGRDVAASLRVAAEGWARAWAPTTIDLAATLWRSTVTDAQEARRFGPERYLEVRYEDLLTNGPAALLTAFAFIGVTATAGDAAAIHERYAIENMRKSGGHPFDLPPDFFREGRAGSWRQELTPTERYRFHGAAGALLCQLGYADDSWWMERAYDRWLTPVLAGVDPRRHLRRVVERLRS